MKRILISAVSAVILSFPAVAYDGLADSLLVDAVQKFQDGNIAAASLALAKIKLKYPDNDAVYYYQGMCRAMEGNDSGAYDNFSKAVAIDSSNLWYVHALASVCTSMGNDKEAYELVSRLVRQNPGTFADAETLYWMANFEMASDKALALEHFSQALAIAPDYFPAKVGVAEVYRMDGRDDEFFTLIEEVIGDDYVPVGAKARLVGLLMNDVDRAFFEKWSYRYREMLDFCVLRYPEEHVFHYERMRLAYNENDYDRVIAECYDMLKCPSAGDEVRLMALNILGDTFYLKGDRKSAYKAYEAALAISPDYSPVLNNYAYFLSEEKKKLRKALSMSESAIAAEPENPTYLDTCGWILYLSGRYAEAEEYFKKAMIYGGRESAEILSHYSRVLDAVGKPEQAEYYRGLLKKL